MAKQNDGSSKTETVVSNILKFFFIFFLILIIILSIRFSGILDAEETSVTTSQTPLNTLPTTTETTTQTTTQITTETTTTVASETTPEATTVETTTSQTTYPPATIPTMTSQTTKQTTTTQTTTTQTTASQTTVTTAIPPVVEPLDVSDEAMQELIEVRYLTIHPNSRSGYKLKSLENIVVHYTGNAGSTADQNWRNFENNKPGTSAHFIIGLDGEIIQCMPLDEVAWAVGTEGNYTSISIEVCHPDSTGKFTDASYESLVRLVSWLCNTFGLGRDDVLRHYDYERVNSSGVVWHKQCPLYWANAKDPESHERWEAFKDDLILN